MNIKKTFTSISVHGDKLVADYTAGGENIGKLPPGVYTFHFDPNTGTCWFQEFDLASDEILDLPSPEYSQITNEMAYFLQPEVREKFKKMGFIYKRSALLYGDPGTGKTCIVNRVSYDVVEQGGIVLFANEPDLLNLAFKILKDIQPETLTMVIFEEFDDLAKKYEHMFLTLLDGETQKENVMYLATTNYLDRVPKRLYRPGRFSSVIKVNFPNKEARKAYFTHKLSRSFKDLDLYVDKAKGLSIDEMKEMIQSVVILNNDLEDTLARIKATRDFTEKKDESIYSMNFLKSAMLGAAIPQIQVQTRGGYASIADEGSITEYSPGEDDYSEEN